MKQHKIMHVCDSASWLQTYYDITNQLPLSRCSSFVTCLSSPLHERLPTTSFVHSCAARSNMSSMIDGFRLEDKPAWWMSRTSTWSHSLQYAAYCISHPTEVFLTDAHVFESSQRADSDASCWGKVPLCCWCGTRKRPQIDILMHQLHTIGWMVALPPCEAVRGMAENRSRPVGCR